MNKRILVAGMWILVGFVIGVSALLFRSVAKHREAAVRDDARIELMHRLMATYGVDGRFPNSLAEFTVDETVIGYAVTEDGNVALLLAPYGNDVVGVVVLTADEVLLANASRKRISRIVSWPSDRVGKTEKE